MAWRLSTFVVAFVAVGVLVACVPSTEAYVPTTETYLYREGGSVARADADVLECELAANRALPQNAQTQLRGDYLARCLASRGYGVAEVTRCDASKVPQDLLARLGGQLRTPTLGSCYYPVTDNVGNVVYAEELLFD